MRRIILCLLTTSLLFAGCKNRSQREGTEVGDGSLTEVQEATVEAPFPELESGEVIYSGDKAFGGTKELLGAKIYDDDENPIRVTAPPMIVYRDKHFAMLGRDTPIILFGLDDQQIEYLGEFGVRGRGPGEITSAQLVRSEDGEAVSYLYDYTTDRIFSCSFMGEVNEIGSLFTLPEGEEHQYKGIEDLINIGEGDYIYACNVPNAKAIFRAIRGEDGIYEHKEIYNLREGMKLKTWTAYLGNLGVNVSKNRIVYAYKYYKMLRFMDMDGQNVKTISFDNTKEYDNSMGMDSNVTHYWGMTYNDKSVFVFYSGRTPVEVMRDNNRANYYGFVEQYDWNGNPIGRYRIDDWGIIFVDEHNCLYSASMNKEGPFYLYSL